MGKGQQPQQALQLLNQMQHRGLLPDVITYNAAISACEKGQQPQQALQLLDQMQHRGLLPDIITYSVAVNVCAGKEQWNMLLNNLVAAMMMKMPFSSLIQVIEAVP